MSAPDLPASVVSMLASANMRRHHAIWHFVRNRWHALSAADRTRYAAEGWAPPRLNPLGRPEDLTPAPDRDSGAGLDFLYMHRRMIEHVNEMLAEEADPAYPRVEGWSPIPWNHDDVDWPMPPVYDPAVARAKDPSQTAAWQATVAATFENDAWLAVQELDDVGSEIEEGIHNWMHMHWSAAPWFSQAPGQDPDDPRNDYLGSTYSSHVNKAFWKLHGWIDDRITQWEQASGRAADFTGCWEGPAIHGHGPHHGLETTVRMRPLTEAEARHASQVFRWALERVTQR